MHDTCYYCGAAATKLCDGVLAYLKHPEGPYIDANADMPLFTCDRPLCNDCVDTSNPVFYDGTDENGEHWGEIHSRDTCRDCAERDRVRRQQGATIKLVHRSEGEALQRQRQMRSIRAPSTRPLSDPPSPAYQM